MKNLQPRIFYPARLSFNIEREFFRQVKTKRKEQYGTYPKRNVENSSLNGKEARIYKKEKIEIGK